MSYKKIDELFPSSGNFVFDSNTFLWFKKGEFIVKFKVPIKTSALNNDFDFDKGIKVTIIRICEFSENTLVLFQANNLFQTSDDTDVSSIELRDDYGNTLIEKINLNYILYSPGGDDTPVSRGPLSSYNIKVKNQSIKVSSQAHEEILKTEQDYFVLFSDKGIDNSEESAKKVDGLAIIDTGIDLNWYQNPTINTYRGFNLVPGSIFFKHGIPFDDDFEHKHGSRIAQIINNSVEKPIHILPIKAFNSIGQSDLFTILCAFEICINFKVKVINASWGFYYKENIDIFDHYVGLLEQNNIWLINASGNSTDFKNIGSLDLSNFEIMVLDSSKRRTKPESIIRFPACLSQSFENVVTVTSVKSKISVIDRISNFLGNSLRNLLGIQNKMASQIYYQIIENYSKKFVSVGVFGSGPSGALLDPFSPFEEVIGSSYATPYISALFFKNYLNPSQEHKKTILDTWCFEGLKYSSRGNQSVNTTTSSGGGLTSDIRNRTVLSTQSEKDNSLQIEGSRIYDVNR